MRRYWFLLAMVMGLLLAGYYRFQSEFPFYSTWDMDEITVLDVFLMLSGKIPSHNHHPGYGLYVLVWFIQKVGIAFGGYAVHTYGAMANSLNPMAVVAAMTDALRQYSPLLAITIVFSLFTFLTRIFGQERPLAILWLIPLVLYAALWHQTVMIRTEAYALFYWSLAVATIPWILKCNEGWHRSLVIATVGFFSALSFLTKVQMLIYVLSIPLLAIFIYSICYQNKRSESGLGVIRWCRFSILTGAFFIATIFIFVKASLVVIPPGYMNWVLDLQFNILGVVYLVIVGVPPLYSILRLIIGRSLPTDKLIHVLGWAMIGFQSAFFIHIFMVDQLISGFQYLLYNVNMVFFRQHNNYSSQLYRTDCWLNYLRTLGHWVHHEPYFFIMWFASSLLLVIRFIKDRKIFVYHAFGLTCMALLAIAISTRMGIFRDTLLLKTLPLVLSLSYLALIWRCSIQLWQYRTLTIILVVGWIVVQSVGFIDGLNSTRYNYNKLGFDRNKWKNSIFLPQSEYDRITEKVSDGAWPDYFHQAETYRRDLYDSQYVLYNTNIDASNIGIVTRGAFIDRTDNFLKIIKYPASLQGALIVDAKSAKFRNSIMLSSDRVNSEDERAALYINGRYGNDVALVPRSDMRQFLFVKKTADNNLFTGASCPGKWIKDEIVAGDNGDARRYGGYEIEGFCQFSMKEFDDWFVVLDRDKV